MKNQGIIVKIFIILFLAATGVMVFTLYKPQNPFMPITIESEIQFETIEKKISPNINEKGNYVVKNTAEWSALWNKIYFRAIIKPELPEIDFDKYTVVAVFNGLETSGGHDIEITKVGEKDDVVRVFVKKTSPGSGCATSQSFSNPYHIVGFAKSDKKVQFVEKEEIVNCNPRHYDI